jgi:peptidoglycan/xylan/chitin deacetylase (PgdA/CDA1 family)
VNALGLGALRRITRLAAPLGLGRAYRVPILMYHRLAEPTGADPRYDGLCVAPRLFAEQMRYLRDEGFTTLSVGELVTAIREGREVAPRTVALSFDDGYLSVLEHGLEPLAQNGLRASIYLITEHHRTRKPGFLTPEQLVELDRSGVFELGSHSRTHPDLATVPDARQTDEIAGSKRWIEELVGPRPLVFCYPFGSHDRRARAEVERAGYIGALSTREGRVNRAGERFALRRVRVTTEPLARFSQKLGAATPRR